MRIRLRPSLLSLGFAFSVLTHTCLVRAEASAGFVFAWLAPTGCPTASEVKAEIDRLLGSPAHAPAGGDLSVHAIVGRDSLWFVTLETTLGTRSGHRTISTTSCQGLANATALIVALMIDPDAVAAHSRPAEAQRPAPAPPAEPAPPSALSRPLARTTLVLAGLGAAGNLGVLPSPDVGISASLGVVRPFWRVELRAVYNPRAAQSETMSYPPQGFGRFRLYSGVLVGCLTFKRPALDLGPCFDFEVGAVRGEGVNASFTSSKTTPWLGLGAGCVVALKAKGWLVFPVHLDVIVPVWRPRFVFETVDENLASPIFRAAVVGGRLTAGVEVQF